MNKRIYNVLMIASKYDMFILEDDGRVDEQIFNEYNFFEFTLPTSFYPSEQWRRCNERTQNKPL